MSARPRVDLDATVERLQRVGLLHAAERLGERLEQASKDNLAPHRFLDRLLEDELSEREQRRISTSLKLSGLPTGQTLGNFDFAFQPAIERAQIETLATCAWLRARETLLIQGPPGVGSAWHQGGGKRLLGPVPASGRADRRPEAGCGTATGEAAPAKIP